MIPLALAFLLASPPGPLPEAVARQAAPYVAGRNFAGVVLVRSGERELARAALGRGADPRGRYGVASLSKSFTAASILLLEERGRLRTSDPVAAHVAGFPAGLTLRHLLEHRSGLRDIFQLEDFPALSRRSWKDTADVVALFRDAPRSFAPGEGEEYSNSNYILLAHVVERVAGRPYGAFLDAEILKPLGLDETAECDGRRVPTFTPEGVDGLAPSRPFDASILRGAGELCASVDDVADWLLALHRGKLLTASSRRQLLAEPGFGLYTLQRDGDVLVAAQGWDGVGSAATARFAPADELAVVVLSNLNFASVTRELADRVLSAARGREPAALALSPEPVAPALAAELSGRFQLGKDFYDPGTVLELFAREGHMFERQKDPPAEVPLLRVSELEFIHRASWGRLVAERAADGTVPRVRFFGRFVAEKLPSP
jgi:CubicO group peptidase (beta-lactamase class C family)